MEFVSTAQLGALHRLVLGLKAYGALRVAHIGVVDATHPLPINGVIG